ncbi:hypothetical protein SKAU_G00073740 [Synaphobranchus kaupii]|uniref:Uncharacterized protein n=1 Tax=Synaphobranchus kaupii TaxID=118154 RepID=A0A9Q1G8E9_SYNKA|nr:hypothetical protein SKAU_G00073740 [Synaphobranchus kaupii]
MAMPSFSDSSIGGLERERGNPHKSRSDCSDYWGFQYLINPSDLQTVIGQLKVSILAPVHVKNLTVVEAFHNLTLVLQDYLRRKYSDVSSLRIIRITRK